MQTVLVDLSTIQSVKDFVSIISKYPISADLVSGRYTVNANSIMGIFSLDISKPVSLYIHSEKDCVEAFLHEIKKYIIT